MENLNERMKKIKSEELLHRFRSKEDLYKYLTIQSKYITPYTSYYLYSGSISSFSVKNSFEFLKSYFIEQKESAQIS